MKKRQGVALLTVLAVMFFTFILSITILNVYLGSVRQNVSSKSYDELEYIALSGVSVMSTYIIDNNDAYEKDFPSSVGYIEIPVDTDIATVYVEETDTDSSTTVYNIRSVATSDTDSSTAEVSVDITRTKKTTNGETNYTYDIGNYIYK